MKEELLKELFDYDNGCLYWKVSPARRVKVGDRFGSYEPNGYRRGSIHSKYYREHRLIWLWHGLELPEGMQIDHINHNRSDNRIDNLRMVTNQENARNKKHRPNSKNREHLGVRQLESGRYCAEIAGSLFYDYLGSFDTLEEAIEARKTAEVKHGYHPNHNT